MSSWPEVDVLTDITGGQTLADAGHAARHNEANAAITAIAGTLDSGAYAPATALYLPGISSNMVSAPDSVALSLTGDLDIRMRVAFDDWTPDSIQQLYSKRIGSSGEFACRLNVGGALFFYWFEGTTLRSATSPVTGVSDGEAKWVRVTRDNDNGSGVYEVKFWLSDTNSGYTQLGTTTTGAAAAAPSDTANQVEIGSENVNTNLAVGKFYEAEFRDGIDGTVVASPSFAAPVSPRHRDGQGNVWTFNGSAWTWELA